jgi:hypothetical protein
MATSTPEKVRENRLRRMADRQGLALHKNRRRDPYALDYGLYSLRPLDEATPGTPQDDLTLDQVEAYLTTTRGNR